MKFLIVFSLVCIISGFLGDPVFAQNCVDEYVSNAEIIGGFDLEFSGYSGLDGNLLYFVKDESLRVVDFSDLTNPTIVSNTPLPIEYPTPHFQFLKIVDHWLLAGSYRDGIFPIDIRKPEFPVFYPPFPVEGEAPSLAYFNGGIFISTTEKQIFWFDSESLPQPRLVMETTISEITDGEIDLCGRQGCFGSGPQGLYFLGYGGYFFKLKPSLVDIQPKILFDVRESEVGGNLDNLHILVDDSKVWYSFRYWDGAPYSYVRTNVVDAVDINIEYGNFPFKPRLIGLNNNQIISEDTVYRISEDYQATKIKEFPMYFSPSFKVQDKLICRNNESNHDYVVMDYSDFEEPSLIDSEIGHTIYIDEQWGSSGFGSSLITPFPMIFYTYGGNHWEDQFTDVFQINSDGLLSPYFTTYLNIKGITNRYYWGATIDNASRFMDLETHQALFSYETNTFCTAHLYTDLLACNVNGNELILNDMTVAPPTGFASWTAAGTIRKPNKLFRDRYFICAVDAPSGYEIVILDLAFQTPPVEIARISDFWHNPLGFYSVKISGDVLSVGREDDMKFFDISAPSCPSQIPDYPYPGVVNEDISVTFDPPFATVYLVPSQNESYNLGQIMVDNDGEDWEVIGTTLLINRHDGWATYAMPCASLVPTELQSFTLANNGTNLNWEFNDPISATDLRLLAECDNTHRDLPFHKNQDGTWTAEIPNDFPCPPAGTISFHLMLRQDNNTWTVIGTVEKGMEEADLSLEITSISPNPCNPNTTITFYLPFATQVKATIYDLAGRRIRTLVEDHLEGGSHQLFWDGRDHQGINCPSGSFFLRLETENRVQSRKITLLK